MEGACAQSHWPIARWLPLRSTLLFGSHQLLGWRDCKLSSAHPRFWQSCVRSCLYSFGLYSAALYCLQPLYCQIDSLNTLAWDLACLWTCPRKRLYSSLNGWQSLWASHSYLHMQRPVRRTDCAVQAVQETMICSVSNRRPEHTSHSLLQDWRRGVRCQSKGVEQSAYAIEGTVSQRAANRRTTRILHSSFQSGQIGFHVT